jgi:hypothetical protein
MSFYDNTCVQLQHYDVASIVDCKTKLLNVVLYICEALGSNLGPETGYPDQGFMQFFSVPQGECRVGP